MDEICRLNALLGEVEHPIDSNRHDEKPKNRVFDIHHPTNVASRREFGKPPRIWHPWRYGGKWLYRWVSLHRMTNMRE